MNISQAAVGIVSNGIYETYKVTTMNGRVFEIEAVSVADLSDTFSAICNHNHIKSHLVADICIA